MVLLMTMPDRLRDAIAAALETQGRKVKAVAPDCRSPFMEAMDCRAVVYLPSLRFSEAAASSPERMRAVLKAAHAPDVRVLVVVLPLEGFDDELAMLRADGVPYVVLRSPMLIDELGQALGDRRWLFVSGDDSLRAIGVDALARAIDRAIDTKLQGRVDEIGKLPLPAWAAYERAAAAVDKSVHVIALWPPLARALRWLARVLRREPALAPARPPLALPAPQRDAA